MHAQVNLKTVSIVADCALRTVQIQGVKLWLVMAQPYYFALCSLVLKIKVNQSIKKLSNIRISFVFLPWLCV